MGKERVRGRTSRKGMMGWGEVKIEEGKQTEEGKGVRRADSPDFMNSLPCR